MICRSPSDWPKYSTQNAWSVFKGFVIIPLHCYRLHCAAGVCFLKQIFKQISISETDIQKDTVLRYTVQALSTFPKRSLEKCIYVLFKSPCLNQVNEKKASGAAGLVPGLGFGCVNAIVFLIKITLVYFWVLSTCPSCLLRLSVSKQQLSSRYVGQRQAEEIQPECSHVCSLLRSSILTFLSTVLRNKHILLHTRACHPHFDKASHNSLRLN